jgi:GTPase
MDASVNRIPSSEDERVFLVAVRLPEQDMGRVEYSLQELGLLVTTAGAAVVDSLVVKREAFDAALIIGRGNLDRIRSSVDEKKITLVVFDLDHIKPAQIRNLEERLKCRVLGRTEIILDIFARRARSSEAKIQVELAQLRYILPRLKGLGGVLSRLGGGIGTRGPGEKMLETDRRHILRRIEKLNEKLERVSRHRRLVRKSRDGQFRGAVVGYTNAGKSTLVNNLARDDLFVEDRLFATLDAYTRIVYLVEGKKVLLTDTVGFINNLPSNLVESFKSTLEEIQNAHFLIHVVDVNAPVMEINMETVNGELVQMQCAEKPVINFFNKSDACPSGEHLQMVANRYPDSIVGSAKHGAGVEELKTRMKALYEDFLEGQR